MSSSSSRVAPRAPDVVLARALTDRILGLVLMPTEACNFRCTYCYEDFALGRMAPALVRGVKALLSARAAGLDELHLSWFGGEPLLALDIVVEVQEHVQALERAHPGLRASSDMTTNAWRLTPNVFEQLAGLGVRRYQITLDGPRALHDRRRRRAGGQGSFERIWGNLVAMHASDHAFDTTLRLHVDRENVEALRELVDAIRTTFGADPRFSIHLRPLSRFGGPNDAALPVLEHAEDLERFEALKRYVSGEPGGRDGGPGGGVPSRAAGADATCYAARGNSFVVRSDGRLGKCTLALSDPRNTVGRLGEDGRVEIDPARTQPWLRGLLSGDPGELACPLVGLGSPA